MISSHVKAFQQVAHELRCQIIVRSVNRAANHWIQHTNLCFPKPVHCPAKTADGSHLLAGLVVNPYAVPNAFTQPGNAQEKWKKFFHSPVFKQKYREVQTGPYQGALVLVDFSDQQKRYMTSGPIDGGRLIHSDYDLLAVNPLKGKKVIEAKVTLRHGAGKDMDKKNLATQSNNKLKKMMNLEFHVQQRVNSLLGIPMIQHGAEVSYGGFAAGEKEAILIFEPDNATPRMGHSQCDREVLHAVDDQGGSFELVRYRDADGFVVTNRSSGRY
jgi:hypothetical protein